jgi:ribosomal protein S6
MCKIIKMKIKILKGKMWGMRKLAKNEIGYPVKVGMYGILCLYSQFRTKSEVLRL